MLKSSGDVKIYFRTCSELSSMENVREADWIHGEVFFSRSLKVTSKLLFAKFFQASWNNGYYATLLLSRDTLLISDNFSPRNSTFRFREIRYFSTRIRIINRNVTFRCSQFSRNTLKELCTCHCISCAAVEVKASINIESFSKQFHIERLIPIDKWIRLWWDVSRDISFENRFLVTLRV